MQNILGISTSTTKRQWIILNIKDIAGYYRGNSQPIAWKFAGCEQYSTSLGKRTRDILLGLKIIFITNFTSSFVTANSLQILYFWNIRNISESLSSVLKSNPDQRNRLYQSQLGEAQTCNSLNTWLSIESDLIYTQV